MTTTPSPRPRGARHAGSWLAAGLGAAAVAVAVAAGRRIVPGRKRGAVAGGPPPTHLPPPTERPGDRAADTGAPADPQAPVPAPGRSGSGAGRLGPETIPGYTELGASLPPPPSDEQLAAWARERGSVTSERPQLPRRQPGAELPESRPKPDGAPVVPDATPGAPDLPLGFLSELHERFRADVEQRSDGPPGSRPGGSPPGDALPGNALPGNALPGDSRAGDDPPWVGGELVGRIKEAGRRPGTRDVNGAGPGSGRGDNGSGGPAGGSPDLPDAGAAVPGRVGDRPGDGPPPDAGEPGGNGAAQPAGGPVRDRRVLGVVVAAILVVVFLVGAAVIRSGGGDEAETGGGAPSGDAGPSDSADDGFPGPSTPPPPPQRAFTEAADSLLEAGSFAYTGAAHATDVSRVRPGLWLAVDVMIAGEVDLAAGRVHETAVALGGGATETVVDGASVRGRTAPSVEGLAEQDYQAIPELSSEPPSAMGAGLVPVWLGLATNPQPAGPDAEGRPTYRATLPAAALGDTGGPPVDAEIALTLGGEGEPAGVRVTVLPDGAALQVVLNLDDLGEAVVVGAPG